MSYLSSHAHSLTRLSPQLSHMSHLSRSSLLSRHEHRSFEDVGIPHGVVGEHSNIPSRGSIHSVSVPSASTSPLPGQNPRAGAPRARDRARAKSAGAYSKGSNGRQLDFRQTFKDELMERKAERISKLTQRYTGRKSSSSKPTPGLMQYHSHLHESDDVIIG
ncbi:hypothetical protein ADUPG1_013502 [Aduncisulcus paluster]|uniref:Uncharacterized protein n=1 Tax=Aduncisulcus paluster TaxID=2918883 RepID=A0ABQ5K383_9EUKA|nr:hypothetical protein ADUPG1_013502 [Aduncisulcus paluster]